MKFGPSGLLKKEIADGGKADVFASANMEHPEELADDGTGGPVVRFARNKMCALVKPGLDVTSDTLLARMLDAKVKLGTSTPRADPPATTRCRFSPRPRRSSPARRTAGEESAATDRRPGQRRAAGGPLAYGWHMAEGRAEFS